MTRRLVSLPPAVAAALPRGSTRAARELSERYRSGARRPGGEVEFTEADLVAYAVTRFPATYAAATAAFEECAAADPTRPSTAALEVLDVGSGLGATAAAVGTVWPAAKLTCLERDPRAVAAGRRVLPHATWLQSGVDALPDGPYDLVTAGYVLNELLDPIRTARSLWERTSGVLVLLEPGRQAAYEMLMAIRAELIGVGAHVLAPCPHEEPCPLLGRDWCHLGQRLPRTAEHRAAKGAERSHEDEPYSWVALSRTPAPHRPPRVIRRPEQRKGLVVLDLCTTDGVTTRNVGRSRGETYRRAKDVLWGQTFE